jgi:hypothetical protein
VHQFISGASGLAILVAVVGYGFYRSLAGQPLFTGKLLQD